VSSLVIDSLGRPQRILLIGGTSEIGLAIVSSLSTATTEVVLAGRDAVRMAAAAGALADCSAGVQVFEMDVTDSSGSSKTLNEIFTREVDIAIIAAGALPVQAAALADARTARSALEVNGYGAAAALLTCHEQMRNQGHGRLVALSSIAAARPRPSNYIYGAGKAMLDFLCRGLVESPDPRVQVLLVRPGFVRTKMTAHMPTAPFATDPATVAASVAAWSNKSRGSQIMWVPAVLQHVARVMSLLPLALLRKLDR